MVGDVSDAKFSQAAAGVESLGQVLGGMVFAGCGLAVDGEGVGGDDVAGEESGQWVEVWGGAGPGCVEVEVLGKDGCDCWGGVVLEVLGDFVPVLWVVSGRELVVESAG